MTLLAVQRVGCVVGASVGGNGNRTRHGAEIWMRIVRSSACSTCHFRLLPLKFGFNTVRYKTISSLPRRSVSCLSLQLSSSTDSAMPQAPCTRTGSGRMANINWDPKDITKRHLSKILVLGAGNFGSCLAGTHRPLYAQDRSMTRNCRSSCRF